MATVGQRGKWAEARVREWMAKRSDADAGFAFSRYPDARAGSLQTAPADFEATCHGPHFKLEVKEIKITTATSRRVPEKNFSADKRARMFKWQMAGDQCWVIVCHVSEGPRAPKEWRLVPLDVFVPGVASWDISRFEAYSKVDDVMNLLFGAKP